MSETSDGLPGDVSGDELWLDRDLRDDHVVERRGSVVHAATRRVWVPPLFVYGSLRSGRAAAGRLDRWAPKRLGPARVRGVLFDLGAYPGWCPVLPQVGGVSRRLLDPVGGVSRRLLDPIGGVNRRLLDPVGGVSRRLLPRVGGVSRRLLDPVGGVSRRLLDAGFVHGELVTLPDPERAFEALDEYEDFFGHDDPRSLYLRVVTRVELRRGDAWEESTAWAYAWNGHGEHPIVASGSWDR